MGIAEVTARLIPAEKGDFLGSVGAWASSSTQVHARSLACFAGADSCRFNTTCSHLPVRVHSVGMSEGGLLPDCVHERGSRTQQAWPQRGQLQLHPPPPHIRTSRRLLRSSRQLTCYQPCFRSFGGLHSVLFQPTGVDAQQQPLVVQSLPLLLLLLLWLRLWGWGPCRHAGETLALPARPAPAIHMSQTHSRTLRSLSVSLQPHSKQSGRRDASKDARRNKGTEIPRSRLRGGNTQTGRGGCGRNTEPVRLFLRA